MFTMHLTDEEADMLKDVMESNLREMQNEIHHTDVRDYREKLKMREKMMKNIMIQFSTMHAHTT